MTTILDGLLGGAVAGAVATVATRLLALELSVLGVRSSPPSGVAAVGLGVAWSGRLLGALVAVEVVAAPLPFARSYLREVAVYHPVLGFVLGVWVGLPWAA